MKIKEVLSREAIVADLKSTTKPDLIRELSDHMISIHPNLNPDTLFEALMQREKLCSTAVDSGVAIPHAKLSGLTNIIAAFGRSRQGIDFDSLDGNPTHLFFLLLAPENSAGAHLKLLARISNSLRSEEFRKMLQEAQSQEEIYELIEEEDEKH